MRQRRQKTPNWFDVETPESVKDKSSCSKVVVSNSAATLVILSFVSTGFGANVTRWSGQT